MKTKGGRQSDNVLILDEKSQKEYSAKNNLLNEARKNPRTLSPEPIEFNEDKNPVDRAKNVLGQNMGAKLKTHLNRRGSIKDPSPGSFEKDAPFFKHTVKDK